MSFKTELHNHMHTYYEASNIYLYIYFFLVVDEADPDTKENVDLHTSLTEIEEDQENFAMPGPSKSNKEKGDIPGPSKSSKKIKKEDPYMAFLKECEKNKQKEIEEGRLFIKECFDQQQKTIIDSTKTFLRGLKSILRDEKDETDSE